MSKVELLKHFGDDDLVVDVARVSFDKEASMFTDAQNDKLLHYLAKHGHTSPFRHPQLHFRIKCPIYVERQLHKHHVGVEVNSISGRYVDFSDTYYKIDQFRLQSESSKQGSGADLSPELNARALEIQDEVISYARDAYDEMTELGVSMEQKRSLLPLALETTYRTTISFQAFVHMCNLRLKPDTQKETRDVVNKMLELVIALPGSPFEESLKAFNLK